MNPRNNANAGRARNSGVLLLHPEDRYPVPGASDTWDLIVDFGHAAASTHLEWSRQAGCRVLSVFDFSADIEDLHRTRVLFEKARGQLVDGSGIDWWDVLSLMIFPEFLNLLMVQRLAPEIPAADLYMSRPLGAAYALARLTGATLHNLEKRAASTLRRASHYAHVVSKFERAKTVQIVLDKFDSTHAMRSRLASRAPSSGKPVVLLPSAYSNVSRMGMAFANAFPRDQFLLVYARSVARLALVPTNVGTATLDAYFTTVTRREGESLIRAWRALQFELVTGFPEFAAAEAAGLLGRIPSLLPWGLAIRDAWTRVFDSQPVAACMSADDTNPYTRLPLIIAKNRTIPTLSCHHGALDYAMAVKTNYADSYLAKSDLERDYLIRVCHLAPEVIGLAPFLNRDAQHPEISAASRSWLVFFSESSTAPWRGSEIYRELMPALASLAAGCGLQLVFKIHPFENKKEYEQWIRQYLPAEARRRTRVLAGAPTEELWSNTRFALTAQSSTALECHERGIPIFLCKWLREPNCGYQEQFARFGIGRILQTPEEIAEIPQLLQDQESAIRLPTPGNADIPASFQDLFHARVVSQI